MSTLATIGQRQQTLLKALLHHRKGLTVDELTQELGISRNAVNQHLASLEGNGFIETSSLSSTGGRPSRIYTLTPRGVELFPKHYALFSKLLIHWISQKFDDTEMKACLAELGEHVAQEFLSRVEKKNSLTEKINEVAIIMHELGYEAQVRKNSEDLSEIVASNCVFHKLAEECQNVCELDLALLSTLLDGKIEHKECMVRGGGCCRFGVSDK